MIAAALAGRADREDWEEKLALSAAWHGAALERQKTLPKLRELIDPQPAANPAGELQHWQLLFARQKRPSGAGPNADAG